MFKIEGTNEKNVDLIELKKDEDWGAGLDAVKVLINGKEVVSFCETGEVALNKDTTPYFNGQEEIRWKPAGGKQ